MIFCYHSSNSAYCLDCDGLYACFYANRCNDSSNLRYCSFCNGCADALFCTNLKNKKYHILNQAYSKEEYRQVKEKILTNKQTFDLYYQKYEKMLETSVVLYTNTINCEHCS